MDDESEQISSAAVKRMWLTVELRRRPGWVHRIPGFRLLAGKCQRPRCRGHGLSVGAI